MLIIHTQVSDSSYPCAGMLNLVLKVFNTILSPPSRASWEAENKNLLTVLEWEIRKFNIVKGPPPDIPPCHITEDWRDLELFQLTLLVYLERASGRSSGQSGKLRLRINKAFTIFSQLGTCQRRFPLLILGCEAQTDEERIVLLDLVTRTEENSSVRNFRSMKDILQSLWAQDDLAEKNLGYSEKIKAVLNSSEILLSFI